MHADNMEICVRLRASAVSFRELIDPADQSSDGRGRQLKRALMNYPPGLSLEGFRLVQVRAPQGFLEALSQTIRQAIRGFDEFANLDRQGRQILHAVARSAVFG